MLLILLLINRFTNCPLPSFSENLAKAGKAIQAILDATGKNKGEGTVFVVVVPQHQQSTINIRMGQQRRQENVSQYQ